MLPGSALDHPLEIDGYERLGPIGHGGMGRVDLARHRNLGRLVAIKWLAFPAGATPPEWLANFQREAESMARVSHPNILTIYDFGVVSGVPYLILEYVEEGDLRHLMRGGRLPVSQVRALMRGVNDAVAYLHQAGIIHRDLKPENILMKAGRIPRVADFGLATFLDVGSAEVPAGTPGYVSPEQRYGLPLDERTDQYALAALSYELLTGEPPVGSFPLPSKVAPDLPPAVDQVLMKALKDSPGARHARVDDFAEAFDKALSETALPSPVPNSPTTAPPAVAHPQPLLPAWLRFVLLAAILVAATFYFATRAGTQPRSEPIRLPVSTTETETADSQRQVPQEEPQTHKPGQELSEKDLINLWAYLLWLEQGQPTGDEGEKLREPNQKRAMELVRQKLESLSYNLWVLRGSLKFEDPEERKAESDRNWKEAHEILDNQLRQAIDEKSSTAPTPSRASTSFETNPKTP